MSFSEWWTMFKEESLRPFLAQLPFEACQNPRPVVALLSLRGVIGDVGGIRKAGLKAEALEDTVEKAFAVSNLKAVAISLNSPGGSPVQSQLIHALIRRHAEKKSVPVLVFTEDVCASGGYWVALAGDEIFASDMSVIGSIGVISAGFGLQDFIKRFGIERRVHSEGEHKGMLDPFLPENPDDIKYLKDVQRDIHDAFIDIVRVRRDGKLDEENKDVFSGAFWSGKKALELGLIDGIAEPHALLKERFGEKVKIIRIAPERSLFARLRQGFSGAFAERLVDACFDRMALQALWQRFGL